MLMIIIPNGMECCQLWIHIMDIRYVPSSWILTAIIIFRMDSLGITFAKSNVKSCLC